MIANLKTCINALEKSGIKYHQTMSNEQKNVLYFTRGRKNIRLQFSKYGENLLEQSVITKDKNRYRLITKKDYTVFKNDYSDTLIVATKKSKNGLYTQQGKSTIRIDSNKNSSIDRIFYNIDKLGRKILAVCFNFHS